MKQHIKGYIKIIEPQIRLSASFIQSAYNFLDGNYNEWYAACSSQANFDAIYATIQRIPKDENLLAILTYCDICYEYGKKQRIREIKSNINFNQYNEILTLYFIYRDELK